MKMEGKRRKVKAGGKGERYDRNYSRPIGPRSGPIEFDTQTLMR